jgi:hypothetical protein
MKKLLNNIEFIPIGAIVASWLFLVFGYVNVAFWLIGFVFVFSVLLLVNSVKKW